LVRYFFLKRPKTEISENLKFLAQSLSAAGSFLAVIVLAPSLDLSGRIETEQEDDQNEDDWSHDHGFFRSSTKKPPR
jgi:hypothetical protein